MNRRDLIQSLLGAMPAASAVQLVAAPHPTDLVIVELPGSVPAEILERMHADLTRILGPTGPKAIVVSDGTKVRVERGVLRIDTEPRP